MKKHRRARSFSNEAGGGRTVKSQISKPRSPRLTLSLLLSRPLALSGLPIYVAASQHAPFAEIPAADSKR